MQIYNIKWNTSILFEKFYSLLINQKRTYIELVPKNYWILLFLIIFIMRLTASFV